MTQIVEVLQGNQTTEVEFPDDMSPQAIEEVLRREFPPVSAVEAEVIDDPSARPSTIGEEWTRGVERLKIDYPTFAKSFSNPEEAALEAMAKGEEVAARLGRPASMDDVMKAYEEEGFIGAGGEVLQAIPRVVASQLPNTGANLAGAFAGSRGVAGLARLLGTVPHPYAKIAGGVLGGAATILPQLFSQNIQRQAEVDIAEERPVEIDAKKATLAAVAQTAAEGVGTYMTLGRSILSRIIGIAPKPRGVRSSSFLVNLAQDSLRGVVRGAGYEIPTEISQQIIERAQAGLDVMSDEAYAEYGEAAYMAGIAGGTIGGVAGAVTPVFSQPAIEDLPGDLPTTADLSEITQETVAPDLPATEPTPDISDETLRAETEEKLALIAPNLRGILKGRGLDDIGMTLSYSIDPKSLEGMEDPQDVNALFDPATRTILLGADRIQGFGQMDAPQLQQRFSGLVDHEMVHAVKRMNLWNAAEWGVLENAARRQTNASGQSYLGAAQASYGNESAEIQSEEAIAELIRDTLAGRTGLAGQPLSLMRRLVEFFRKMGNALTGTGYASFGQVVNDIDSGVLGARPRGGRQATPVATPMIVGSPAFASRKKVGYLRSVEDSLATNEGDVDFSKHYLTDRLNIPKGVYVSEEGDIGGGRLTATRTHRGKSGGSGSTDYIGEINYRDELARRGRKAYAVRDANFQSLGTFSTEQEALDALAIKGRVSDQVADQVGEPMYPPGSGLSPNFFYKDEDFYGPEAPVSLEGGATLISEDALRQTLDKEIASRRLRSNAEGQQVMNLEGMTGEEVAIEEARVAARKENRRVVTEGLKETRKLLRTPEEPLASRGRLDRAKEQGFDTSKALYHGTKNLEGFNAFDPEMTGKGNDQYGAGFYLTTSPQQASGYAEAGFDRAGASPPSSGALPLYTRTSNLMQVDGRTQGNLSEVLSLNKDQVKTMLSRSSALKRDLDNEDMNPLGDYFESFWDGGPEDWMIDDLASQYSRRNPQELEDLFGDQTEYLEALSDATGFDGLNIDFGKGFFNEVHWKPENIRSVNAEFDPARTESTNLLASRQRLPHGLPESLTVDGSGKMPAHKVVQNFTPSNRSTVTANITKILENNPEALATYNAWVNAEEDAFGGEKVPVPPYQAIAYAANPELLADKLNQLTPDLKATVDEGFGYVNDIKNIYESGTASPELTGRLFLWGILSRGAGPVQQETAFLNILNEATPFIEKSASGNLTQNDLDSWLEIVSGILPEGSPARSVTMNVNAAGKLLFELGKKAEGSDSSVLSVLHDSLSNPNQTAAEFRRKFFALTDKPGIDNKVVSFISLVAGKPDVLVMDRIQSRHLWDDGRFDGANIYDGVKVEGRPQGTGLNEILTGPRGLLITEMLENGLRDSVVQAYEIIGRPQDASLGRMHWETWVIEGNQGVPHSTLQAVKTGSPIGYSVTEGKRGTYASGAAYRQTENGLVVEYLLSDGTLARMTPTQFVAFKKYISKPANKIVPKKFKVSESTERPWFESQGVDRGALDDAARRYENANPDGTIRSSYDESTEAGDSLSSRERTRRAGRGKLKTKPEDSAALAEDKSKAATEVRGNPEADQAASEQLRTVKKLASRNKPSDIVEGTAYNRVADIGSRRASRGQGNINNAFSFEAPSGADDKGFVYQIQDKFIDLKKAIESIKKSRKKRGLTPLASIDDPYLGEESMHGIIGNKFNRFQKEVLEPLVDKLVARNISKKELEEFLVLRHAIERNAHVRKINAKSKQPRPELEDGGAGSLNGQRLADDYVKNEMQSKYGMQWNDSTQSWEGGNPRASVLNDLAADFDSITRGTLQELKDSGLMDQESLDKLQSYYKYYAPLRGVSPEDDVAIEEHARFSKSSNHLSIKGVETETTKGRVSEALPPLAQIVTQRQAAIRRGSINELIGQRMLTLIRENPNDSYWQIHNDRDSAGSTAELVGVKEDGKQLFIEFKDRRLRDAMLSLDAPQTNKALAVMRKINRFFSAVNTSYNPAFIFGNFFRDIGTAMGNLVGEQTMVGGKALNVKGLKRAVIFDTASSIRQVYRGLRGKKLSGKNAQDWKDYLESGAKTEWFHVQSPEESAASIDQLIEMAQGTFKGNYASGKQAIGNIVSDLNSAVENGVRFATFKKARDGFVRMGLPREEALAKAATLAKNLTVNFNRMGNQGEMLNAFYLFFNASVQGTANFVRGITTSRSKQAMLLSMVSFGAFVTRINELMGEDDEELGKSYYSEIEPWVKERNFILMKSIVNSDAPPNEYYTIPLPYGYNVLHVLGMDIMEVAMGIKSPEAATTQVAAASLGSFMPVGFGQSENPGTFIAKGLVPQIGKPIVEMLANEDFFASPVYTENFQFGPKIPAALRSQRSTPAAFTETTKFLNAMTGGDESHAGALGWISPDVLDHLFGTILGGMGSFVERSGQSGAALTDWVEGDYVEGDISINDIPFLRRAMREVTGRESQSRYYDRREDIMADDRQMGLLRGTERREYRDKNRSRLLMKRTLDATDKRLRNINRRLAVLGERILTSTSLEQTLRLEEMQSRLEDQKESAYKRFNKRFNERVGRTE